MTLQPIEILLVEDNPADALLTTKHLQKAKIANRVHIAEDGEEALAFLRREGRYVDAVRPDLILLDLNLPKLDGRELLAAVKSDASLRVIPVVVLTSSESEDDIARAYGFHANCYVVKPIDLEEFSKLVSAIDSFWFTVVRLPSREVA